LTIARRPIYKALAFAHCARRLLCGLLPLLDVGVGTPSAGLGVDPPGGSNTPQGRTDLNLVLINPAVMPMRDMRQRCCGSGACSDPLPYLARSGA
jgi:hypothetical protein